MVPEAAGIGVTRTVFVGTTRGVDVETGEQFSFSRNPRARFSRLDISVPPDREPGQIAWPKPRRIPDPQTEFVTTREDVFDASGAFRVELARALRALPPGEREAVVFVHGFNNTFAEGIYRIAQLSHDLDLPGVDGALFLAVARQPLGLCL